jgi:ATP/maltotriose-dependent transcriptional regulator MalT
VLTRLVDKSLVVAEERDEEAHYWVLEPIRQYAREHLLAREEEATISRRHAAHLRALAEQAEPELWGQNQTLWLGRLEGNHANLRTALGWVHESAEDSEGERRLVGALGRFWQIRGELAEGRLWLKRALAAPASTATRGWATALTWGSGLAHTQGDPDEAEALGQQAVTVSRELGDPIILGRALITLASELTKPGDQERAIAAVEEGLVLLRAAGDRGAVSIGLGILAEALRLRGDLATAGAVLEDALAQARFAGHKWAIGIALQDLAHVARERGDPARASALFAECLVVAQEIADSRRVAECLEGFAVLAAEAGRAERAARLLGAAHGLREVNGSVVEPVDLPIYNRSVAAARQALGEDAFAAAWDAGRTMPLDQAVQETAVARGTDTSSDRAVSQQPRQTLLTVRQYELAKLIARGLSNPQIADQLVISRRTADRHVSNILDKLGFASRGQIAAWITDQEISRTRR